MRIRISISLALACACSMSVHTSAWAQFTVTPTCTGGSGDRATLQAALNSIPVTGGTLVIPAVGSPCYIAAVSQAITHISNGVATGVATATATIASIPTGFPPVGGVINVHNSPNGAGGTVYNGTYVITLEGPTCGFGGATPCFQYDVATSVSNDSATLTGSNPKAEIGLYWLGNNLRVVGTAGGTDSSTAQGSVLTTDGADTILTVMSNTAPRNGPTVENVSFLDTTSANAFAGLEVADSYGFLILNCGFSGFNGTGTDAAADPQGGAGIVLDGTTVSNVTGHPWTQFALVADNFIQARLGITTKHNVSSIVFEANQIQCGSTASVLYNSVGLDIGGIWYLTQGGTTGGESTVTNQQTQACMVGTILGGQNDDRVYTKTENGSKACTIGPSMNLCSVGLAVLNSQADVLFNQTKSVSAGLYIDSASTDNKIYENSTKDPITTATGSGSAPLNSLCSATSSCTVTVPSWTVASNVVDSADMASTAFLGVGSTGSYTQTTNSTFTVDALPVQLTAPALQAGTSGATTGTVALTGATSGTATITAQAAAGTPTLTLPTANGTLADGASAPLSLNATTGALTASLPSWGDGFATPAPTSTLTAGTYEVVPVPNPPALPVTGGTLVFDVQTGDGGGTSDIGFATGTPGGTCTAQSHIGANARNSTGVFSATLSGVAGVSIPAVSGTHHLYLVWTTSTNASLKFAGTSVPTFVANTSTGTTTLGSLGTPGSATFTCPSDSPVSAAVPSVAVGP